MLQFRKRWEHGGEACSKHGGLFVRWGSPLHRGPRACRFTVEHLQHGLAQLMSSGAVDPVTDRHRVQQQLYYFLNDLVLGGAQNYWWSVLRLTAFTRPRSEFLNWELSIYLSFEGRRFCFAAASSSATLHIPQCVCCGN